jgi:hypothetical protein
VAAESVIVIRDIPVMYVAGDPAMPISEQAPIAFDRLEAKLATLKGRRFYGVVLNGAYRACVAIKPDDDPDALPHPTWSIPGGRYVRQKLANWEQHRHLIGPSMMRLRERTDCDASRLCIEYYRSQRELLLLVPIV